MAAIDLRNLVPGSQSLIPLKQLKINTTCRVGRFHPMKVLIALSEVNVHADETSRMVMRNSTLKDLRD
jgi:hypothetical protein